MDGQEGKGLVLCCSGSCIGRAPPLMEWPRLGCRGKRTNRPDSCPFTGQWELPRE